MLQAENIRNFSADLYLDKNRKDSTRVTISKAHAAAISASSGDAITVSHSSFTNSVTVSINVIIPEVDNTPTFKIYRSSPSKPVGSQQDPAQLNFPPRLLKILFGSKFKDLDQLTISTSTNAKCLLKGVDAEITSEKFAIRAQFLCLSSALEYHLPKKDVLLTLLDGIGLENGSVVFLPLLNGVHYPFKVEVSPSRGKLGIDTSISVLSASSLNLGLDAPKYVPISQNIRDRILWMLRSVQARDLSMGKSSTQNLLPRSLLVTGLSGTGKTSLISQCAREFPGCMFLSYSPTEIQMLMDEDPDAVRLIFERAASMSDSQVLILFFDDLDVLLSQDDVSELASQHRTEQLFVEGFQRYFGSSNVNNLYKMILVGSVTFPDRLAPVLRRLFGSELAIDVLSPQERRIGLKSILETNFDVDSLKNLSESDMDACADSCVGFSIGEIVALARQAYSISTSITKLSSQEYGLLTPQILQEARILVRPVAIRAVGAAQITRTTWKDVGGMEDIKSRLSYATGSILNPKLNATFQRFGVRPARGVLLFGPPGTGKTLLARAVATESAANFIYANISEILSSGLGESEAAISAMFRSARRVAPSIIFFDEIQALFGSRDTSGHFGRSMIAQLLLELDAAESQTEPVLVMAATNRPDFLDPSFLRPGRFDELIYVPPPDAYTRRIILSLNMATLSVSENVRKPTFIEQIISRTHNFTGADLANLCARAGMKALERDLDASSVDTQDFENALKEMTSSVTLDMLQLYFDFQK